MNLAPNGKPSNLTPEQYKLVRTKAFKKWFGDWENDSANASKVVDENGEPLVVFHKTDNKFTIFDKEKLGSKSQWGTAYFGFYFSNKYEKISYGKKVIKCFLSIKNPYHIESETYSDYDYDYKKFDINNFSKNDGIEIKTKRLVFDEKADKHFVAFEPNQIKLADGTNTTFDSNNNDIRFDEGGLVGDVFTKKVYIIRLSGGDWFEDYNSVYDKYEDALNDYNKINNSDFERYENSKGLVKTLSEKTLKYKFVAEIDEDDNIDDYTDTITLKNKTFWQIIDDGEWNDLEADSVERINEKADKLLSEVYNYYGRKYNTIYLDEDETISLKLRIADHSGKWKNKGSEDYFLSIVISDKNPTEDFYINSSEGLNREEEEVFNSENTFEEIIEFINEKIEYYKEKSNILFDDGGRIREIDVESIEVSDEIGYFNDFIFNELEEDEILEGFVIKYYHIKNIGLVNVQDDKFELGVGYIWGLEVFEEYKGKGFGKKIMEKIFILHPTQYAFRGKATKTSKGFWLNLGAEFDESDEYSFILSKDKLRYADGGLLAPNGKQSNLTAEQYKLVRTKAFKEWFGDWENDSANASKVVDSNGEPLVLWHGSKFLFNEFKLIQTEEAGFHFGTLGQAEFRIKSSKEKYFYQCFLNIRNVVKTTDMVFFSKHKVSLNLSEIGIFTREDYMNWSKFYNIIKEKNIDGLKYENSYEGIGYSYMVFSPNQIKLADGSNTTFDSNNNDIRFDGGGIFEIDKFEDGQCYNNVQRYLHKQLYEENYDFFNNAKVIIGDITNNKKEVWHHAWIEHEGIVYDPTIGIGIDEKDYYKNKKASNTSVFSAQEYGKILTKTKRTHPTLSSLTNSDVVKILKRNIITRFDEGGGVNSVKVYHGTTRDFKNFDTKKLGEATKSGSAKNGFWFTDDIATAKSYARAENERKVQEFLDRGDRELALKLENLIFANKDNKYLKEIILTYKNPLIIDADGSMYNDFSDEIMTATQKAKNKGNDILIVKNLSDNADYSEYTPATHYLALDNSIIKSSNSDIRFDEGGEVKSDYIKRVKEAIKYVENSPNARMQIDFEDEEGSKQAINEGKDYERIFPLKSKSNSFIVKKIREGVQDKYDSIGIWNENKKSYDYKYPKNKKYGDKSKEFDTLQIANYDDKGKIVGIIKIATSENKKQDVKKGSFKISVRGDYQNKGIASKLIEKAESEGIDFVEALKNNNFTSKGRWYFKSWLNKKLKNKVKYKYSEGGMPKKEIFKSIGSAIGFGTIPIIEGHDMVAECDCGEKFTYQNSKKDILWQCPKCNAKKGF